MVPWPVRINHLMSQTHFRRDIEGLRGIAVVSVLLFHLAPGWMPGGFQGVDIFFVLSGYLITQIILTQGDNFSFLRFYLRRFWRLFPALIVTIGASLVAGYILLAPSDFRNLGESGLAAAVGLSNLYFYALLDYFNDDVLAHPLLHTWSLGVEEQFYLAWPLLIVLTRARFNRLVIVPVSYTHLTLPTIYSV